MAVPAGGIMDAVAIGLIVLVLSGAYLWYGVTDKRRLGLGLIALGTGVCLFFVLGIGARLR
jgi:hypothetical protein